MWAKMEDRNSKISRAAEHHLVMEVIENAKHTPPPKAEADKGNEAESKKEAKNKSSKTYYRNIQLMP